MRRLFSSTGIPQQGAVPRNFAAPTVCLSTPLQSPVTPPGCGSWTVKDNNYGALPKSYPFSVSYGAPYYTFFGTVDFSTNVTWTSLWIQLDSTQRALVSEQGCYCGTDGGDVPTMTPGDPRPPQITPLPFFWMPPPDPSSFADIMLPDNPVEESLPANCCPGAETEVPHINVDVVDVDGAEKLKLTLVTRKQPEFKFRSDYATANALLQNGFPKFCCGEDPCDTSKTINMFIEYPAWLTDVFDPYGETPEEPLGIVPIVMDVQYDIETGKLGMVFAHQIVHNGRIIKVNWDTDCPHASDDYSYGDSVTEPGVGLEYNEDWLGNQLIEIVAAEGGACGPGCELTEAVCAPSCNPAAVPEGFVLTAEHEANGATESEAAEAAIAAAEAASEIAVFCFSELVA